MSEIAISLRNVSKCFKQYAQPIDRLKDLLLPHKSRAQAFWALQDIDLQVARGETLGIIGQNGSGKSTLLQIIAGTLQPTTGEVYVNGRISALLELGSGFNPEFTGRQNVFFNGSILGLSREEIEAKFDDIAAFAEIGGFIDQPVKTYSSGMVVRLAFAVIANTEPSILIVDEALAVGDAKFQARCMRRIRQLKEQGVTLLFVSHDSASVKMLCRSAILMNQGRMIEKGTPKYVVNRYIALLGSHKSEIDIEKINVAESEDEPISKNISNSKSEKLHRHGNKLATIENVLFVNLENQKINNLETGESFKIIVVWQANLELDDVIVGISIRNLMGTVIYGTNTQLMNCNFPSISKHEQLATVFQIPCLLNKGIYTVTIGIHSEEGISYDWIDESIVFEVNNSNLCDGIVDLEASVEISRVQYVNKADQVVQYHQ